jgi:hypothetical protein
MAVLSVPTGAVLPEPGAVKKPPEPPSLPPPAPCVVREGCDGEELDLDDFRALEEYIPFGHIELLGKLATGLAGGMSESAALGK